jgi:hypothetical protein
LLPINNNNIEASCGSSNGSDYEHVVRQGHVRSHSVPTTSYPAPYRMSLDYNHQGMRFLKKSSIESSLSSSSRFWKVKLVISPEQLVEILAQEARTKELIESVRIVAKCGDINSSATEDIVSDQWSLSNTSWSISSKTN